MKVSISKGIDALRPPSDVPTFRNKDTTSLGRFAVGILQVVATDHCVFTSEQKLLGKDNFAHS